MKQQHYSQFTQQQYFAQQLCQITPRYISTSYGQVYSLTAGTPGQPLILIVHGSGPKNSCQQYKYLLQQYLVRISYIQKFYMVAIDCPGYGLSVGSKQAVKTFPRQLFQEILNSLGYKQYFAMMGHSQGGAAIFNACYQNKILTEFMLMDRPVCGNIQRFRKFNIPTLLIYDIQDDGHPIWQGKLLYKELAYTQLYTYRNSEDQYWVHDHIWDTTLKFFQKYYCRNNRKNGIINTFEINNRFMSTSVNIQDKSKDNKNNNKKISKKIQQKQVKQTKSKHNQLNSSSEQKHSSHKNNFSLDSKLKIIKQTSIINKTNINLQKIKQTQKQDLISIYSNSLSEEQKIQLKEIQKQMKLKEEEFFKDQIKEKKKNNLINKIQIDETIVIGKIQNKQQQNKEIKQIEISRIKQSKQKDLSSQQKQYLCSICYEAYYRPMQTNCHHIFCTKCLIQSILVNQKCPLCRGVIKKRSQRKDLNQKLLTLMPAQQISRRQKAYLKVKLMLESIVYIQLGNRSIELQTKKSLFTKTKRNTTGKYSQNKRLTLNSNKFSLMLTWVMISQNQQRQRQLHLCFSREERFRLVVRQLLNLKVNSMRH